MKGKMEMRDCKASGGAVEGEAKGKEPSEKETPHRKKGGKIEGKMAKMRLDRPGRKAGGRVGADKAPLTEAAKSSKPKGRSVEAAGMEP